MTGEAESAMDPEESLLAQCGYEDHHQRYNSQSPALMPRVRLWGKIQEPHFKEKFQVTLYIISHVFSQRLIV